MSKKASLGCRLFVPWDQDTDIGLVVPVFCNDKKVHKCDIKVMVHPEINGDGVIFWFNMDEMDK